MFELILLKLLGMEVSASTLQFYARKIQDKTKRKYWHQTDSYKRDRATKKQNKVAANQTIRADGSTAEATYTSTRTIITEEIVSHLSQQDSQGSESQQTPDLCAVVAALPQRMIYEGEGDSDIDLHILSQGLKEAVSEAALIASNWSDE